MKAILIHLFIITLILGCNGTQAQKGKVYRVSNEEFATLMESDEVQLIDVRTPNEFKAGHIEGATLFNIMEKSFIENLKSLDKTKPVLVYCAVGGRSYKASRLLKNEGFSKIYDLKDGIKGWVKEGYKVKR